MLKKINIKYIKNKIILLIAIKESIKVRKYKN